MGSILYGIYLAIEMVIGGIFMALSSVIGYPLIELGRFIERMLGRKEVNTEDDSE